MARKGLFAVPLILLFCLGGFALAAGAPKPAKGKADAVRVVVDRFFALCAKGQVKAAMKLTADKMQKDAAKVRLSRPFKHLLIAMGEAYRGAKRITRPGPGRADALVLYEKPALERILRASLAIAARERHKGDQAKEKQFLAGQEKNLAKALADVTGFTLRLKKQTKGGWLITDMDPARAE